MRPTELTKLLTKTIPAGLPVLIKGAPGVGKSDIVAQACKAQKADLVLSHPVVSDPTDYKGLPGIVDGCAEFLPFGDLKRLIHAKRRTVCFLDDLGQAPAVVQAAAMQLILARQINGHRISDHVTFLAATNRREDRAGVTGILEPVKSRFATIVELTPNLDDWCGWALENNVPSELVGFVRFRPELLLNPGVVTNDIVNRPSPRTVTQLGRLWSIGIQDLDALAGAAGQGFAVEYLGFVRICNSLPSIDAILLNPSGTAVPAEPAALYAIATALGSRTTDAQAKATLTYLNRLPAEWSVLGVRDAIRKCPTIQRTREFIQWATEHQGVLS